jgi:periplasmic divalent cation tolerance protein
MQIVGPAKSTYWWKGTLEQAEEWIGIMKTRSDLYDEAERELKALHPYEVPEIMAVEAMSVSAAYEKWVVGETTR